MHGRLGDRGRLVEQQVDVSMHLWPLIGPLGSLSSHIGGHWNWFCRKAMLPSTESMNECPDHYVLLHTFHCEVDDAQIPPVGDSAGRSTKFLAYFSADANFLMLHKGAATPIGAPSSRGISEKKKGGKHPELYAIHLTRLGPLPPQRPAPRMLIQERPHLPNLKWRVCS